MVRRNGKNSGATQDGRAIDTPTLHWMDEWLAGAHLVASSKAAAKEEEVGLYDGQDILVQLQGKLV